jgi:hypothetical protein
MFELNNKVQLTKDVKYWKTGTVGRIIDIDKPAIPGDFAPYLVCFYPNCISAMDCHHEVVRWLCKSQIKRVETNCLMKVE